MKLQSCILFIIIILSSNFFAQNTNEKTAFIGVFKPVVNVQGLEWKFIRGEVKTEEKEGTAAYTVKRDGETKPADKKIFYEMELSVTNRTNFSKEIKLRDVDFRDPQQKNKGTANDYTARSFNKLVKGYSGRIKIDTLAPGETKQVFIYALIYNFDLVPNNTILHFILGLYIDNQAETLENYNIPISSP